MGDCELLLGLLWKASAGVCTPLPPWNERRPAREHCRFMRTFGSACSIISLNSKKSTICTERRLQSSSRNKSWNQGSEAHDHLQHRICPTRGASVSLALSQIRSLVMWRLRLLVALHPHYMSGLSVYPRTGIRVDRVSTRHIFGVIRVCSFPSHDQNSAWAWPFTPDHH